MGGTECVCMVEVGGSPPSLWHWFTQILFKSQQLKKIPACVCFSSFYVLILYQHWTNGAQEKGQSVKASPLVFGSITNSLRHKNNKDNTCTFVFETTALQKSVEDISVHVLEPWVSRFGVELHYIIFERTFLWLLSISFKLKRYIWFAKTKQNWPNWWRTFPLFITSKPRPC